MLRARFNPCRAAPGMMEAVSALERAVVNSGLERSLIELIKTCASHINRCACCIHQHTRAARTHGESEERLYLLNACHASPLYSARERAAPACTGALTLMADTHAPDADCAEASAQFDAAERVRVSVLCGTINAWSRSATDFRLTGPVEAALPAARVGSVGAALGRGVRCAR